MFGSFFGKKEVISLMINHSIARQLYSETKRNIIAKYGHIIIKLFGYPLSLTHRKVARANMSYLSPIKGEKILDIGCGVGHYSFELASKFKCKVYGLDIDIEDIGIANKIATATQVENVYFIAGETCHIGYLDEVFDKILLSQVIERIREDEKALQELHRVLKLGGYLIIATTNVDNIEEYQEQESKIYETKNLNIRGGRVRNGYSFRRLSEILNKLGFRIIHHKYLIKKQGIVIKAKKLSSK